MKTKLRLPVLTFLLVAASNQCFALMSIADVTKARAKELGVAIRSEMAGTNQANVWVEFNKQGELKNFSHAQLEITAGERLVLSTTMVPRPGPTPDSVLLYFSADRVTLPGCVVTIAVGALSDLGYRFKMKDLLEQEKSAGAATPEEEERFVIAVRKAFEARDASGLAALTCWDRVPEKSKQNTQSSYAGLVGEKDCVFDFKLVDPDRKFVDSDRTEDGVVYRANLPVTRQLSIRCKDTADKKTLMVISFPVGEKDGKVFLLGSAPVK